MLSWPPTTTIEASPFLIACQPKATARRPEPQSWLMPSAVFSTGMPELTAAWRAGFWPWAGGQDLAQDDFVDFLGLHLGALERALDRDLAEVVGRHGAERAIERADRRARSARDDDVGCHVVLLAAALRRIL